ncbi:sulfurtransferase [Paenibacillus azoreducens]|uniref:Thiosulfate sulfurtransferase n=1 Tax=Paenibacillus azoreducens TaxID=116718 RepID=A0A919Y9A8_9BACL|nr:sulfurtransferase [Paenibacillus azoreducens]GIO45548.1 thiosulfate sulfurtransferase [Paenibacillus azoreducens]
MNAIVSKPWVLARMYEPDVTIVDCRFELGQPEAGREAFEEEHIPRAVYLDLEKDLSSPVREHGGRHPLPDPEQLSRTLAQKGITPETRVIAYDDQGGMYASRLYWLLKYLGHGPAYVMDEGFSAWKAAGYPVSADQPIRVPASYSYTLHPELLASMEDVREAAGRDDVIVIDSRDPRRYQGLEETMDKAAGHIPGAKNKFWKLLLDENGKWMAADQLQEHYQEFPQDKEIIVYCGSGVSACPNFIGLKEAGYENVKLYSGSWSDWISYSENPIATGEE